MALDGRPELLLALLAEARLFGLMLELLLLVVVVPVALLGRVPLPPRRPPPLPRPLLPLLVVLLFLPVLSPLEVLRPDDCMVQKAKNLHTAPLDKRWW